MAIVVKRDGNHDVTDFEYLGYCPICGELFKYKYSDLSNPISAWHELHINCPTCGRSLAFSDHPIETRQVRVKANEVFVVGKELIVPKDVEVYGIYQNGTTLYLQRYQYIVPAGVPMVFMIDQVSIDVVDAPQLRVYPNYPVAHLATVNEGNYQEFYTISKQGNIIRLKEVPETGLGIWMEYDHAVVPKPANLQVSLDPSVILEGSTAQLNYSSNNPEGVYTVTVLDPTIADIDPDTNIITGIVAGTARFRVDIEETDYYLGETKIVSLLVTEPYQVIINNNPEQFHLNNGDIYGVQA